MRYIKHRNTILQLVLIYYNKLDAHNDEIKTI